MVDRGPGGPRPVDQAHGILSSKINLKIIYPRKFARRPLGFFVIKLQSPNFQEDPWFSKIFPNISLATFQKFQIGPYNFFFPYLWNRNSDFGDSLPKILGITSSFILCIHLTHACCILLIDSVCFALGNTVPEPFFKDFQVQAFKESQFFFAE
jgi:hypothetical protein